MTLKTFFCSTGYAENVHKDTDDVIMAYCAEHLSSYPRKFTKCLLFRVKMKLLRKFIIYEQYINIITAVRKQPFERPCIARLREGCTLARMFSGDS